MYVELLLFLILFPLIPAIILSLLRSENIRVVVVTAGAGISGFGSILLLAVSVGQNQLFFTVPVSGITILMLGLEVLIAGYLVMVSVKAKQYLVTGFVLLQLLLIGAAEWIGLQNHTATPDLIIDQFSAIMAVIIGVIGGLICIYALGYMREYQAHHPNLPDQRARFFAILFLFLFAMFGLVFANNLIWMYFFWEVTTLCSYLLIRYSETDEAIENAFRALLYNLIGGACFPLAILAILIGGSTDIGLGSLIAAGPTIALVPACLIAIAGCAKSAQLPFSSWLVGAMVAPTPVSALLHSSTMVKAGVYVIVRFAPVFEGQILGMVIALIGGVTFLVASCIAISQSNAKKVLAYSTIANLGLIVACAGVGTPEALWAAIFLIIFHAISKSLLFLSVGTVEHRIGSRDIEDMTGLAASMPRVSLMMLIGIAGMFLAPFGMLISKWASIHAFSQALPPFGMILIVILAYGSAVTVFFWAKWMGKLLEVRRWEESIEVEISRAEWTALITLTALTIIACFGIAPISTYLIEPFLIGMYGPISTLIPASNLMIMLLMLALIVVLPVMMMKILLPSRKLKRYMGGISVHDGLMEGSAGIKREVSLGNLYLEDLFPETGLSWYGSVITIILFCILGAGLMSGGVL